ncbi:MAG: hypothetical protein A2Z88_08635 [Omnitrophica WOR_2 bacterium GWA2_47_8]|nr:MAG: hypothetical protein A2Z88_08635 [Omnitrophica WOR_2 bacterium GWA2_47_8]
MNAFELVKAGGPIMYPILLCSIIALGIVIEKFTMFNKIHTNIYSFKKQVIELLKTNKLQEAVRLCDNNFSPVAKISKAGILKFGRSREEIKEAMEDASHFEIPPLERRLTTLNTIAQIAPLLGLLGTVTGMTESFHTIQMQASTINPVTPGDLAGGIWAALLTTVAGLCVAIPTYVAYNYFVSRVNYFVLEMEKAATDLLSILLHLAENRSEVI